MIKEELLRLINDDRTVITPEIIDEASEIFSYDADNSCELTSEYLLFYYKITALFKGKIFHNMHISTHKYVLAIESGKCDKGELLSYLYLKEVEFYLACNVTHECMHYINKILDMENVADVYKGSALAYGATILIKNNLLQETEKYLFQMLNLYDNKVLPERIQATLLISILASSAFAGYKDIFEAYESFINTFDFYKIGKDVKFFLDIYELSAHAMFNDYSINNILKRLDEIIIYFNNKPINDDLSIPFLPIFRRIQTSISKSELIGYAVMVIRNSSMITDKLAIYEYLTQEAHITEIDYNGVHKEHYNLLKEYYNSSNEISVQCIVNEQISYEIEKQFKEEALIDPLTELGNRFAYETELKLYKGKLPSNLIIVMFDLNGLKRVNDTFGHAAGDIILCEAGAVIKEAFGSLGKIFRIGGDEFILVAKTDTASIANGILRMNAECDSIRFDFDYQMTIACGFSTALDYPYVYIDELVATADNNMYENKQAHYEKTKQKRRK